MVIKYSKEIVDFITANVEGLTNETLAKITNEKFGTEFTAKKMQGFKKNHNLKSGIRYNGWDKKKKLFPDEIKEFILQNYKGIGNIELKDLINNKFGTCFTTEQMKNYKSRHKLDSGLNGQFVKGQIPPNKGKKMSPEMYEKCKATMFKKGHTPDNHRPVGSERVGKDGYLQIKVAEPNKWQQKNVYIYEQHYGKVPKGHKVVFLDQNSRNFDISNLALVSNGEMLKLNQYHRLSENAEVSKVNITLTKLERKIRERKKGK